MVRFLMGALLCAALISGEGCGAWDSLTGYTPAQPAVAAQPAVLDAQGNVIKPAVAAQPAKPAVVDVANSPAAKALTTVDAVGGYTPFGPIIHLATTGLLGLLTVIGFARGGQWKNAALATAQGLQNGVSQLDTIHAQSPIAPSTAADIMKKAVDAAHDDHGVNQGMQNALTPVT